MPERGGVPFTGDDWQPHTTVAYNIPERLVERVAGHGLLSDQG